MPIKHYSLAILIDMENTKIFMNNNPIAQTTTNKNFAKIKMSILNEYKAHML